MLMLVLEAFEAQSRRARAADIVDRAVHGHGRHARRDKQVVRVLGLVGLGRVGQLAVEARQGIVVGHHASAAHAVVDVRIGHAARASGLGAGPMVVAASAEWLWHAELASQPSRLESVLAILTVGRLRMAGIVGA